MGSTDDAANLREEVSRLRHQVAILQGDLSGAHFAAERLQSRVLVLEQSSSGHLDRLSDLEADLELCNMKTTKFGALLRVLQPLPASSTAALFGCPWERKVCARHIMLSRNVQSR